jgi:hypothetical protein
VLSNCGLARQILESKKGTEEEKGLKMVLVDISFVLLSLSLSLSLSISIPVPTCSNNTTNSTYRMYNCRNDREKSKGERG